MMQGFPLPHWYVAMGLPIPEAPPEHVYVAPAPLHAREYEDEWHTRGYVFSPPAYIVYRALDGLRDMERSVLCSRFGIGVDRRTLRAIGQEWEVSPERIRQVEGNAIRKTQKSIIHLCDIEGVRL